MSIAPLPAEATDATATGGLPLTRPQKVAAVMLALGQDAERILMRLPEADVERIAQEVVTLGELSAEQIAGVLDELHSEARAHRYIVAGGEHHARELLRRWRGTEADSIVDRMLAAAEQAPFNFLNMVPPIDIARALAEEHPQTAAVVLAHVSTALAAQVLSAMPADVRADVAIRIATRQPCADGLVARIEEDLRGRLGDQTGSTLASQHQAGMRELASMLNRADEEIGSAILGAIEERDTGLASQIRQQMFVFADLASLADRDLQEVLRTIDTAQLALAMKGVDGILRETILRNLSQRARDMLAEELELLGPARKDEIELARTQIATEVRTLVEEGTVTIVRDGDGDVVA